MATDEEKAKLADLKKLQDKIADDPAFRADFFRSVNKAVSEVSAAHGISFDPSDVKAMRASLNLRSEGTVGTWIGILIYAN